ncbi:NYN domain-containing protein [Luteolibacter ambystomatis]|uniref:NYN domain-containing protein n=1 Tax=Luteolibacter ambystomatis TaxID=2824561 RepID=A0A975PFD9_9BACT|nr:NYN domain-containing protein [Luteolibacter ambystomatis]QUE51954.1 NYN domain-containing protein [Luteolibacter ambystomatis]
MEQLLIVDGHSAIFAIPRFAGLHRGPTRYLARLELVKWLQRFGDASEWKVVVVFDGKQAERGIEGGTEEGILILYSRNGETADSVIERLAARFGARDQVKVASDDRMVLLTASAFGAETMRIAALEILVEG